jgi:hypothetical protein
VELFVPLFFLLPPDGFLLLMLLFLLFQINTLSLHGADFVLLLPEFPHKQFVFLCAHRFGFGLGFFGIGFIVLLNIVATIANLLLILGDRILQGLADLFCLGVFVQEVPQVSVCFVLILGLHNNYNLTNPSLISKINFILYVSIYSSQNKHYSDTITKKPRFNIFLFLPGEP